MAAITFSGTTNGTNDIDGLSSGVKWNESPITFGFPTSAADYLPGTAGNGYGELAGFFEFRDDQKDAIRLFAEDFNAFAGTVVLVEDTGVNAVIRCGRTSTPEEGLAGAWAYFPSTGNQGGDLWIEKDATYDGTASIGTKAFMALGHELGHAMGLKHPHGAGAATLSPLKDAIQNTIMSYCEWIGDTVENWANVGAGSFPQSWMMLDIKILQFFYGKNTGTRAGNTLYTINNSTGEMSINGVPDGRIPTTNKVFRTVWDANGDNDQVLGAALAPGAWASTANAAQLPDLGGGHTPPGMIANALDSDSTIEGAAAPPATTGRIRLLGLRI